MCICWLLINFMHVINAWNMQHIKIEEKCYVFRVTGDTLNTHSLFSLLCNAQIAYA
jgi:hypothetical protein